MDRSDWWHTLDVHWEEVGEIFAYTYGEHSDHFAQLDEAREHRDFPTAARLLGDCVRAVVVQRINEFDLPGWPIALWLSQNKDK